MKRDWEVLLICGGSGTGKSTLAKSLSKIFEVPLFEIDDLRIAFQSTTDPKTSPELFFFINNPDYQDLAPEEYCQRLLDIGKVLAKPINSLIGKHLACHEPIIMEGDGLIPHLIEQVSLDKIRVLVIEDDASAILDRMVARSRGDQNAQRLSKEARQAAEFCSYLRQSADKLGIPAVSASPIETLLDRTLLVL